MGSPTLLELRTTLAVSLRAKRRLYLDLMYWNHLCDVELGASTAIEHTLLLSELRELVRADVLTCPIEFTLFAELFKQRLPEKRAATARLIDELSGSVTLVSPLDRCMIEALRVIEGLCSDAKSAPQSPPFAEVWTKVAFLVGHGRVVGKGLSAEEQEHIDGIFRETLWDVSFAEVFGNISADVPLSFDWAEQIAEKLNREKVAARSSFPSQRAVYLAEVRGALEVYGEQLGEIVPTMFRWSGGDPTSITSEQRAQCQKVIVNTICALAENPGIASSMPFVHILAMLYSRVQWDERRKYKANDIQDFAHAAAALGYCNAFATERSLASLIAQAKLDTEYGTAVFSSVGELRRWLATLRAT